MTVHVTVINVKGIEKSSPDTLTGFCKCYFAFLQVKWKFPNAGRHPAIFPRALALHLGSVWSAVVHCNWWLFWAHADGQCRQGALLGMAATSSLAPRLLAAQDTRACCALCLHPCQPDTHQPARHAPDKLNGEGMVSPKAVSPHLGGKNPWIRDKRAIWDRFTSCFNVIFWTCFEAVCSTASGVLASAKHTAGSTQSHLQWHIPDGTDTSVSLSSSLVGLPWALRDIFILWKSHWGATEQRRPWDNLRITLLWQCSEQQRPAVRGLHRPLLQLREEKRAKDHYLKYNFCHLSSPLLPLELSTYFKR